VIEFKSSKAFTMGGIEGRTVTGIFTVHGNVDDGDGWSSRDRSHPGVFGDFTVAGRDRAVFLWQHNSREPPIATIDRLFEVSAIDLPPAVKLYAPDATGGVAVTRTYLETPRAEEVLAGLKSGALKEMSYAYDLTNYAFTEDEGTGRTIREIYAVKIFDWSDVLWGMNSATLASKGLQRNTVSGGAEPKVETPKMDNPYNGYGSNGNGTLTDRVYGGDLLLIIDQAGRVKRRK